MIASAPMAVSGPSASGRQERESGPSPCEAAYACLRPIADTPVARQGERVIHRAYLPIAAVLSGASCESIPQRSAQPFFANPAAFVGQQVRLCGFFHAQFEDFNVWPTRASVSNHEGGLGFMPAGNRTERSRLHNRRACIRAEIVRTGCAEDRICHWSNFPYAARELTQPAHR